MTNQTPNNSLIDFPFIPLSIMIDSGVYTRSLNLTFVFDRNTQVIYQPTYILYPEKHAFFVSLFFRRY